MGVTEIHDEAEWNAQMQSAGGKLVVADFSATWCGPCQFIKPTYEQYSRQYTDVVFLGVDEGQNRSLIGALGVRGFPTFHFYLNQRKVDELVGADPNALRQKIEQWRQSAFNPFASPGVSLGGSVAASVDEARAARLRRFNQMNLIPQTNPAPAPAPAPVAAKAATPKKEDEKKEKDMDKMVCDLATGICSVPGEAAAASADGNVPMEEQGVPPVDEELLSQLKDMGFDDLRSRKALLATDGQGLDLAINWISEHQEDTDIDEPIKFVDLAALAPKKQLTPEEKAAKIAELQAKIEQRRIERAEQEKQEQKIKEKGRRTTGKEMQEAREEYAAMQRKLESEKRMREREEAKRERERLRKQIEMDKLERRANGGKLTGAPSEIVVDSKDEEDAKKPSTTQLPPEAQISASIAKLQKYRVGGDGLTALKTLNVYVKNLIEKPDEDKFRTINLENPAFRKRVASLVGGISFLKAIGYEKDEADGLLKLSLEKRDDNLLRLAKRSLESAIAIAQCS